jgi:hypothetical protein
VPIVTPHQSKKVLQVQTVDRSDGWGHASERFHIVITGDRRALSR